jgi:hypothetical protein
VNCKSQPDTCTPAASPTCLQLSSDFVPGLVSSLPLLEHLVLDNCDLKDRGFRTVRGTLALKQFERLCSVCLTRRAGACCQQRGRVLSQEDATPWGSGQMSART